MNHVNYIVTISKKNDHDMKKKPNVQEPITKSLIGYFIFAV